MRFPVFITALFASTLLFSSCGNNAGTSEPASENKSDSMTSEAQEEWNSRTSTGGFGRVTWGKYGGKVLRY